MNLDSLKKHLRERENEKPFLMKLLLLFCIGAVFLMASTFFDRPEAEGRPESFGAAETAHTPPAASEPDQERELERRLAAVLSLVQGAGRVEVMLTFSGSREIILAEDTTTGESLVRETDSAGGSRENHSLSKDMRTILVQSPGGGQEPIILREIVPRVEGVIIVAEGGDDVFVREALTRAAGTVLGVDIHRVQVLVHKITE